MDMLSAHCQVIALFLHDPFEVSDWQHAEIDSLSAEPQPFLLEVFRVEFLDPAIKAVFCHQLIQFSIEKVTKTPRSLILKPI